MRFLEQFPEYRAFKAKRGLDGALSGEAEASDAPPLPSSAATTTAPLARPEPATVTPEEAFATAAAQLDALAKTELLERLTQVNAALFERIVLDVALALGYGGSREDAGQQLGRSGDEGVDGVIREDPLGLDRIYLQAKRYAADRTVGRPELQGFVGALTGQGAQKGVFLTTGRFSREARTYVERLGSMRVVLIDGDELTTIMLRQGAGVRTTRSIPIRRIDLDYFDVDEA